MSSRLTFFTFELNQHFNDFLLPFPIRWNKSRKRWEKDNQREVKYYTVLIITLVCWTLLCIKVIAMHFTRPGLFDVSQVFAVITQIVSVIPCIAFVLPTMLQSDNVVQILNVVGDLEKKGWSTQTKMTPRRFTETTMRSKLSTTANSFLDLTGIVLFFCIFLTITVVATSGAFFITVKGWEPIYLLMVAQGKEQFASSVPVTIARCVVWLFILHVAYGIGKYNP